MVVGPATNPRGRRQKRKDTCPQFERYTRDPLHGKRMGSPPRRDCFKYKCFAPWTWGPDNTSVKSAVNIEQFTCETRCRLM